MSTFIIVFYFGIYLPILVKELFFWLWLWQNREYRGDKMYDYLTLPESKKVIYNRWRVARSIFVIVYVLTSFVVNSNQDFALQTFISLFYAFLVIWFLEVLEFGYKLILKPNFKIPNFTKKAILISSLSFLTLALVLPLVFRSELDILNVFYLQLVIIVIPFVVGYWILVFFPLDHYLKNRFFKRAKIHRQDLDKLEVVAISGAYGKTTTKDILNQFLSIQKQTLKTEKNQNSNVSCAKKTLLLKPETQVFLCEIGAYRRGDGNEICDFIKPTQAIITGLNHQHYSLFGSVEDIILAESESLKFLPNYSVVCLNWSSDLVHKISVPSNLKVVKYGVLRKKNKVIEFDIWATDVKWNGKELEFKLNLSKSFLTLIENKTSQSIKKKVYNLKTNLYSTGNLENLLGALALSLTNGISLDKLSREMLSLDIPHGSLELISKPWGYAIDDSYNANYDGVRNAVEFLASFDPSYKKILVLDDILELGSKSIETHIKVGKVIEDSQIDKIFLLGRNFADRVANQISGENKLIYWNGKNTLAIKKTLETLKSEAKSVILFEGYQSRKFID